MSCEIIEIALNNGFDKAYLLPQIKRQLNLKKIMPEAESVLLLLKRHKPYKPFPNGTMQVHSHYRAYQKGYFLHKELIEILKGNGIKAKSGNIISLKSYAAAAGMNFLKNSLVCDDDFGSYFLMQAIVLDVKTDIEAVKGRKDLCGECDLCIKACPVGAIHKEGGIDVKKCIRSHVPVKEFISEDLRKIVGRGYIGCGICQSVCPKNSHIEKVYASQELYDALNIERILKEGRRSAIKELKVLIGSNEARPGRTLATACMIAGNIKDEKHIVLLENILATNTNPLVRGYAAWALGQMGKSRAFLMDMLDKETDNDAKKEIISAINAK